MSEAPLYLDALVLGFALKEDVGERHLQDQRFRHLFLVPVPGVGSVGVGRA